jgi:nucleotide-binding universal stress UspA family protein
MQTIVVGYDGSEPASRALDRATELVDEGGTAVLVRTHCDVLVVD